MILLNKRLKIQSTDKLSTITLVLNWRANIRQLRILLVVYFSSCCVYPRFRKFIRVHVLGDERKPEQGRNRDCKKNGLHFISDSIQRYTRRRPTSKTNGDSEHCGWRTVMGWGSAHWSSEKTVSCLVVRGRSKGISHPHFWLVCGWLIRICNWSKIDSRAVRHCDVLLSCNLLTRFLTRQLRQTIRSTCSWSLAIGELRSTSGTHFWRTGHAGSVLNDSPWSERIFATSGRG